jgi:hypothetical protein
LAEWPPNRTGRWSGTRAGHVTEPGFTGPVPPDRHTRRRTSPAFTGHNECSQKKFPAAAAPALPPSPAASSHSPRAAVPHGSRPSLSSTTAPNPEEQHVEARALPAPRRRREANCGELASFRAQESSEMPSFSSGVSPQKQQHNARCQPPFTPPITRIFFGSIRLVIDPVFWLVWVGGSS